MDAIDIEINGLALKPRLWVRYVGDVFAIWPHGKRNLDLFLRKINSINPAINLQWRWKKTALSRFWMSWSTGILITDSPLLYIGNPI